MAVHVQAYFNSFASLFANTYAFDLVTCLLRVSDKII